CLDIFSYIGKSDTQTTFSERHTARPNDVPLPWRVLSNDGLCFVQPLLLRGAVTGHASSTQIAQAAYTLLQRCVVEKGVGGIAADIGGDNHLNVVIADYAPHVRCDRSATPGPPWNSCLAIVADMVATRDRKVFGDKGRDPRVEVSDENPDLSQNAVNIANVSASAPLMGLESSSASSEISEPEWLSDTSSEASTGIF
ncbi:MAG: hypothetical protein Q9175_006206, partial [Cornicularia normoerica]